MIAAWNSHLLIASLTLTALAILSVLLTRKLLWRQPAIAHGFLVFVLLGFVITLPMQFSSKELVKANQAKGMAQAELKESSESLALEVIPHQVPFDYFPRTDEDLSPNDTETTSFQFEDVDSTESDSSLGALEFMAVNDGATPGLFETNVADSDEEDLLSYPGAKSVEGNTPNEYAALEETGSSANYWENLAQILAPVIQSPWILMVHLIGLFVALVVEFLRYRKTNRIIRGSTEITDPRTLEIWQQIAGESAKKVQLRASSEVHSPVCWGIARQVVIVPAEEPVGRETAAFKWAIRHELVHIHRGDPRTTLFQSVLRSVFWFHPASWWLNREIDRLREISCDDAVVGQTGSRKSYAMALIEYARHRDARAQERTLSPTAPALISWSGSSSQLERRIRMLAQTKDTKPRSARLFQAAGAVGVALMLLGAQVTLAANMPTPQSLPEPVTTDLLATSVDFTLSTQEEPKAPVLATRGRVIDFLGQPVDATVALSAKNIVVDGSQDTPDTLTIGVHLQPFSNTLATTLGMPAGSGLIITKVVNGSNAERAGLKDNDPILKINGNYASMEEIRAAKKRSGGKKSIKFTVMRGAKIKNITVRFNRQRADVASGTIGINSKPQGRRVVDGTRTPPRAARRGGNVRDAVPGPTGPSKRRSTNVAPNSRRLPQATRRARSTPEPRATTKEKKLEREVRDLNRRLDRLTKSIERQGQMLERLMSSPRRNSTNGPRTTTTDRTRSRYDREKEVFNRTAENLDRLKKAEAREKAAIERALRSKDLGGYRLERAKKDAERAVIEAKKRSLGLKHLDELESHQAKQKARYHDLLALKSLELAESSSRMQEVENALVELEARHADVANRRREVDASKLAKAQREKVLKTLIAAEKDLKKEAEYLRRHKAESTDRTAVIRAHRKSMIAEYEAKIADLEKQTKMLRREASKKNKKSPKKRVIIFDDDFKSDGHDK
ncbi:MAG: beta-lactamase regulating signal transducer with metallopeptidase domain [Planctomycetota bacterium]|jgi:beta-lactamase regulating signal transducer with metallopeptidase domain